MAKTGRKGKHEKWLTPDGLLLLSAWTRDGLTDEDIAKKMGISCSTLYSWKKTYLEISESLKKGKEIVDIEVENALLKNAIGGFVTVQEPIKVKIVLVKDGTRQEKEEIKYVDKQIYIKPDPVAQFFWLQNRNPEKWRNKPVENNNNELNRINENIINISELIRNPKPNRKLPDTDIKQSGDEN